MAVALVLVGAGWGSNQFTPMLLVYRHALGLSAGSLEAMFGVYALGLIPGLLAGPLSDAKGRRLPVLAAAAGVVGGEPAADRRLSLAGTVVRRSVRGRARQWRGVQRGDRVAA